MVENEKKVDSVEMESNWSESIESFEDLNLKQELLRGIYGFGWNKPSKIQQTSILPFIKSRDLIAQAQS